MYIWLHWLHCYSGIAVLGGSLQHAVNVSLLAIYSEAPAYPTVLTGAWEPQVMTEEQMKLHEGLQRMGKQFILDTLLDSNVLHNCVKFFPSAIMALIFVCFHCRLHLIVCRSHLRRTVACYLPLQSMPLAFLYCARLRPRSSAESASVVSMQCVNPSDPR